MKRSRWIELEEFDVWNSKNDNTKGRKVLVSFSIIHWVMLLPIHLYC